MFLVNTLFLFKVARATMVRDIFRPLFVILTFTHDNCGYVNLTMIESNAFGFKCNSAIRSGFFKKTHNFSNSVK